MCPAKAKLSIQETKQMKNNPGLERRIIMDRTHSYGQGVSKSYKAVNVNSKYKYSHFEESE